MMQDKRLKKLTAAFGMHVGWGTLVLGTEKNVLTALPLVQNIQLRRIFMKCGKAIFLPAGVVLLQSALRDLGHG